MARLSMVQLQQALTTSFPDNSTGLITPAIVRDYFNSLIEAIRPAYGVISRPNATAQVFELTPLPVIFDTGYVSDVPDYTTTPALGTVTRLAAGSTRIILNATLEGPNGRLVAFSLYKNNAPTLWKASVTTLGTGKPVDISIVALTYDGAQAEYKLMGQADAAATSVTISNADMLCETIPVNTY